MSELIDVVNAMFVNKSKWADISDEDKDKNFFIVNRYMSKKYPDKSQLFNDKSINKISAMDMWYNFMLTQSYPKWFWSKSKFSKNKTKSDSQIKDLMIELDLRIDDLEILIKYYPEEIKEELKFIKDAQKIK